MENDDDVDAVRLTLAVEKATVVEGALVDAVDRRGRSLVGAAAVLPVRLGGRKLEHGDAAGEGRSVQRGAAAGRSVACPADGTSQRYNPLAFSADFVPEVRTTANINKS